MKNLYGEKRTARGQAELNVVIEAHERYAASRGGTRAQLAHAELDGLDLSGRRLPEADFAGASLVGADLHGADLERASFYCADLRDCDLRGAKLTRADLRGASFKGARLAHAVLDDADLRAAMMMYVGAEGVQVIDRERTQKGTITGVDFSNCSMKGVSFGNAKLDGADFTGALLCGANFKNAKLANASFKGAVLTGVNLKDLSVPPEALEGAIADVTPEAAAKYETLKARLDAHQQWIASAGAQGSPANFDGEDLRPLHQLLVGRSLSGLSARNTICVGLEFSGSQMLAARFDGADLRDADFSNTDLRGASLRATKLTHARFDRANLGRLALSSGGSLPPDLHDADGSEEQFYAATMEDTVAALGLPVKP